MLGMRHPLGSKSEGELQRLEKDSMKKKAPCPER